MAVFHLCFFTILCSFFLAFFMWRLYVFLQGRFVKNLQVEKYFQTAVALINFLQKSNNSINFLEKGDCDCEQPMPFSFPSQPEAQPLATRTPAAGCEHPWHNPRAQGMQQKCPGGTSSPAQPSTALLCVGTQLPSALSRPNHFMPGLASAGLQQPSVFLTRFGCKK